MAIVRPESMDFSNQTFSMIIYGSPGIGKTTLALSAPDPVLLDFDHGISRVRAIHRKATSVCSTYEEILADVNSPEMKEFKTIVIDTGGSFVTYLKDWAMRVKGAKQKNGEFNSLKGFGFVKSEFNDFTEHVKKVLGKNVIYVFHSQEQSDKDGNPTQRLMCEGSVRNTVWNGVDFGGYVQMIGDQRVICFSPEQEYFAKGTHGLTGRRPIPTLNDGIPNDFVSRLFEEARSNIKAESDYYLPKKEKYAETMAAVTAILESVVDAKTANDALALLPQLEHELTSKKESSALLRNKTTALGLILDKENGLYIPKEAEQCPAT